MKISQVVKSCFHRSGGDISSFGQLHTKEHHAENNTIVGDLWSNIQHWKLGIK